MKRILAILIFLFAAATIGATAETVNGLPKPTGYVSDVAGVLSPEDKAEIERQCTALHQKTGTQIAVVTIHHLEGATAQEFAHGISDAWGVGSKGTDKGIVLLIATDDRKRWIDVGYGLEGVLNDAKVGDIGRAMVPALKDGRYGEGIELGVGQIASAISGDPALAVGFTPKTDQKDESGLVAALFFGSLVVIVALIFLLGRRRRRTGPGYYPTGTQTGTDTGTGVGFLSSSGDSSSSSSDSGSSSSSSSDFGGFDGGSSGGGGAGGDF